MVMPDIFSAVTQSEEPQPHPFLASFLLCSAHCSNTTHRQYPWVRSSFPGFLMAHTLITHHFLPTLPPTRSDEFLVISLALQTIGFFFKIPLIQCVWICICYGMHGGRRMPRGVSSLPPSCRSGGSDSGCF